jgi:hypothetical protein
MPRRVAIGNAPVLVAVAVSLLGLWPAASAHAAAGLVSALPRPGAVHSVAFRQPDPAEGLPRSTWSMSCHSGRPARWRGYVCGNWPRLTARIRPGMR